MRNRGTFGTKMIKTLANELCKDSCPIELSYKVFGKKIDSDDLKSELTIFLLMKDDEFLWKLYDRTLYHTRYKKHRLEKDGVRVTKKRLKSTTRGLNY